MIADTVAAGSSWRDPHYFVLGGILFVVVLGLLTLLVPDQKKRIRARLAGLAPKAQAQTARQVGKKPFDLVGAWIAESPLVGAKEQAKMEQRLIAAGLLAEDAVTIFIASKAAIGVLAGVLTWFGLDEFHWLTGNTAMRIAVILGGAMFGWYLPDLFIGRIAAHRRKKLKDGMADALDLLVICVESGLGLEQGLDRVARDIAVANPVVSMELRTTVAEMKVLPNIRDALDNLAKRSELALIKSIVTTFIQSLQYGTPLAQALRVLAAEMRAHRILEIEARAAQLPVWMTIPLILFILPCLFLVIGGPAAIQVMDLMK